MPDQLTEDDVLRLKELPEGTRPHRLHGARLQVHQHGAGHVLRLVALAVVHGGLVREHQGDGVWLDDTCWGLVVGVVNEGARGLLKGLLGRLEGT